MMSKIEVYFDNYREVKKQEDDADYILNNYYQMDRTDWENVYKYLDMYKEIQVLFNYRISPKIQNILYTGNKDAISELKTSVQNIRKSLDSIAKCIEGKKYTIKLDDNDFDPQVFVESMSTLVDQLASINELICIILPYLKNKKEKFASISNALDSFDLYRKYEKKSKVKPPNMLKRSISYIAKIILNGI